MTTTATATPTDRFFETLASRRHEPLLEKVSGRVRFDLSHGEQTDHWMVTVRQGDVEVTREDADADSVVRVPRDVFDLLASGRENAFAALLRGKASAEGNLELPVLLQRLLPGPPRNEPARPEALPTPSPGAVHPGAGSHAGSAHSSDEDSGRR
jgi:putative sterol carrier protein